MSKMLTLWRVDTDLSFPFIASTCIGDGTISQVVNGYMLADGNSKGCAVGIISSGTGGDFVRTTKTPKDPREALVSHTHPIT